MMKRKSAQDTEQKKKGKLSQIESPTRSVPSSNSKRAPVPPFDDKEFSAWAQECLGWELLRSKQRQQSDRRWILLNGSWLSHLASVTKGNPFLTLHEDVGNQEEEERPDLNFESSSTSGLPPACSSLAEAHFMLRAIESSILTSKRCRLNEEDFKMFKSDPNFQNNDGRQTFVKRVWQINGHIKLFEKDFQRMIPQKTISNPVYVPALVVTTPQPPPWLPVHPWYGTHAISSRLQALLTWIDTTYRVEFVKTIFLSHPKLPVLSATVLGFWNATSGHSLSPFRELLLLPEEEEEKEVRVLLQVVDVTGTVRPGSEWQSEKPPSLAEGYFYQIEKVVSRIRSERKEGKKKENEEEKEEKEEKEDKTKTCLSCQDLSSYPMPVRQSLAYNMVVTGCYHTVLIRLYQNGWQAHLIKISPDDPLLNENIHADCDKVYTDLMLWTLSKPEEKSVYQFFSPERVSVFPDVLVDRRQRDISQDAKKSYQECLSLFKKSGISEANARRCLLGTLTDFETEFLQSFSTWNRAAYLDSAEKVRIWKRKSIKNFLEDQRNKKEKEDTRKQEEKDQGARSSESGPELKAGASFRMISTLTTTATWESSASAPASDGIAKMLRAVHEQIKQKEKATKQEKQKQNSNGHQLEEEGLFEDPDSCSPISF